MKNPERGIFTPRVNAVPIEWTHNYLIPFTLKEFYRKGLSIVIILGTFTASAIGAYLITDNIRGKYETEIATLQADTTSSLAKYTRLKELSREFSQLAEWKAEPNISAQFSAISYLLLRNRCFLVSSVFHSDLQNTPEKLINEILRDVERLSQNKLGNLKILGLWNLSLQLPMSGLNTNETRKAVVAALQKESTDLFKTTGGTRALLIPSEEQQTLGMLRNHDNMNAVLLIWEAVK